MTQQLIRSKTKTAKKTNIQKNDKKSKNTDILL